MKRSPHSKDLRKGRHSEPNARYFVTFNAKSPSGSLASQLYFEAFRNLVLEIETTHQLSETSFTIMPDHVHMVFRLGEVLSLSQVVGKLKQVSRKNSHLTPLNWQDGFHDHKLRSDEELHPIVHYIYLNPYRAKLLKSDATWPYTHVESHTWEWFQPLLEKDCPYPEWLCQ